MAFWHPSDLDLRLQSICAAGIWTSCGKDFEKETIISCIYHKFQMVYSGITDGKQRVHWWNGSNFSGKFHLNGLTWFSAANSLMFIISLIRGILIFFSKARFLGSWGFGGCQDVDAPSVFTQSATYGESCITGEWGFFFFFLIRFGKVFKHLRHREKHHVAKCERTCTVWNRYGRMRHTVLTCVAWRIIFL